LRKPTCTSYEHRHSNLDADADTGTIERIEAVEAGTGTVLDSRGVSGFDGGAYLWWTIRDSVQLRVTRTAGAGDVLSVLFID
jgi:hypothetical protein